jgi:DNA-binding transcriptional LysR family regulator
MELRHLRYLVAVSEEGSIVRAARRLRVAQPALSRQIRALEQELGGPLFDRSTRSVTLNAAGEVCLRAARAILTETQAGLERARLTSHGKAGRCVLSVGTIPLWSGFVASIVSRTNALHPGIELVIDETGLRQQWDAVRGGVSDIGLGVAPPHTDPDLVSETQLVDALDAVGIATDHALATRRTIRLDELRNEPFVFLAPDMFEDLWRRLGEEFARRGSSLRAAAPVATIADIAAVVAAGQGWTLIPRALVERLPSNVAAVSLEDASFPLVVARVWRRADRRPLVRTVLDVLRHFPPTALTEPNTRPALPPPKPQTTALLNRADRIELRHLRYFMAAVDEGSIGRAAERLGLTQPALSRQLRDLEHAADARLVERKTRGVAMTPAGAALYQSCRKALDWSAALETDVARAHRAMAGECLVATVPTNLVARILSDALEQCATRTPAIRLTITRLVRPEMENALRDGRIDVAIAHAFPGSVPSADIDRYRLADDTVDCVLVSPRHALTRRNDLALRDLSDTPFLFVARDFDPAFYDFVMRTFATNGFRPLITGQHAGLQTLWALAAEGRGWCLGWTSQRNDPPSGLVALPVRDLAMPWATDAIARAGDARLTVVTAVEAFRAAAARIVTPSVKPPPAPLGAPHDAPVTIRN